MNKVILIGLDGFRPDMVTASLTPHLLALSRDGVLFTRHRSVFPSETYVNVASIMTGAAPADHGIIANEFLDPKIDPREPWIGSRIEMVEAGLAAYAGALLSTPTLGDRLAEAGRRFWAFGGGSPGSARLIHPLVAKHSGHLLFVGQHWRASSPQGRAAEIVERLGEPPAPSNAGSNASIQEYLTDAFLLLAADEPLPDATILWFGEPDHAYHTFGLGAEPTLTTLRAMDSEVGRLVEWWRARPDHDRIQLIVTSDHGHITQTRAVDTAKLLIDAGFRVGRHLEADAELALVPGYCGNIRVRNGDRGLVTAAAQALMAHPDIGLIFTRSEQGPEGIVPGTFSQSFILTEHPRSADIVFTLHADDDADSFGFTGTCRYDNSLLAGAGIHGGLHPAEMSPFLIAAGSAFGGGVQSDAPSSVIDILPTILELLGEAAHGLQGRVLEEAFADPGPVPEAESQCISTSEGSYAQELRSYHFGTRHFLDHGRRVA